MTGICPHSESIPTKLTKSNGVVHVVMQCTTCGSLLQWCVKKGCDVDSLPEFDGSLKGKWLSAQFDAQRELSKQEAAQAQQESMLWHAQYEAYLQSDEWQALRMKVLMRDNFTCQCCLTALSPSNTHVHHRNYRGYNEGFTPAYDLITVCSECHERIHGLRL